MKFPVKTTDIHKIEKKNYINNSTFSYINEKKHLDLLFIGEQGKRLYVVIKDFNTFMYDHKLHRGRKHFTSI